MLWKCCTQYTSKFGKLSSGQKTGKGQFSFQSQRKARQKNAQTTTKLYSSHKLVKAQNSPSWASIIAGFRKGRGTRDQVAKICWIIEKAREFHKNIYLCFINYAKALSMWITTNCGKFWKRWEYQTTWPASWEICMQVRKQQQELDRQKQTGSK